MLPLWRDEVSIYLGPRKIALARRMRGMKPRVGMAVEVAVQSGSIAESDPVLARLAEVLRESTWQDAPVRIVVADPWVRFAIVTTCSAETSAACSRVFARSIDSAMMRSFWCPWAASPTGSDVAGCC